MNISLKVKKIDKKFKIKLSIIFILLFFVVIILILDKSYFSVLSFLKNENAETLKSDISSLDSGIENILDNYGIKKEWRYRKVIQVNNDFSRYERVIYLPYNVPIVTLNHEIASLCQKYDAVSSSTENIKNQIISFFIKYRNNVIESIKFVSDPNLERYKGLISIIFENLSSQNEIEQAFILQSSLFSSFLVNNTESNEKILQKLFKSRKEYYIFLTLRSNEKEGRFEISNDLDSNKISRQIRALFKYFENSKGIIYQAENAGLKINPIIPREVLRHHKYFINIKDFCRLEESEDDIKNADDIMQKAVSGGEVISICSLRKNNIKKIYNSLTLIQKKGFKFVPAENLLNNEKYKN